MFIYLDLLLPTGSSDLPETDGPPYASFWSCFEWGLHMPRQLPDGRWSLKPPFHPYRIATAVYFCCTGLGVASTGRYPASCPMKPGLSSPATFRYLQPRPFVLLRYLCDSITSKWICKEFILIQHHQSNPFHLLLL